MSQFKFEGFKVGEKIRAEDFEPCPGRGACYIEGGIVAVNRAGNSQRPYSHYVISISKDVFDGVEQLDLSHSRLGDIGYVPMETSMDWDSRVQAVRP